MKPEEKQLLLKDLCARLPYGVKVLNTLNGEVLDLGKYLYCLPAALTTNCKPYLRPMSSMTAKEAEIYNDYVNRLSDYDCHTEQVVNEMNDWLLSRHFDVRSLVPKDLALIALDGMYKTE